MTTYQVDRLIGQTHRLERELREARAATERVRALHGSYPAGDRLFCLECVGDDVEDIAGMLSTPWPCKTIKALDGDGAA